MVTEIQVHDPFSGGHIAGWSIIQRDMQFIEFSVFQIIGKRDEKFLISAEMRKVINAVYADFRLLHGCPDFERDDLLLPIFRGGETIAVKGSTCLRMTDIFRFCEYGMGQMDFTPIRVIAEKIPGIRFHYVNTCLFSKQKRANFYWPFCG